MNKDNTALQKKEDQQMRRDKTIMMLQKMTTEGTSYYKRFQQVMGQKAPKFISSVIAVTGADTKLAQSNPQSILSAAMQAAILDLDVVKTFGFAAIIPYKDNKSEQTFAQFQVMTRGYIQLALRTGQYEVINSGIVYEDEYEGTDFLTGLPSFHEGTKGYRDADAFGNTLQDLRKAHVAGFFAFFRTKTGYQKASFWTLQKLENHAKRYSKSYAYDLFKGYQNSMWSTDFRVMAEKTVLKNLLTHWGILSTDLKDAITEDQQIFSDDGSVMNYLDNPDTIEITEEQDTLPEPDANKEPTETPRAENIVTTQERIPEPEKTDPEDIPASDLEAELDDIFGSGMGDLDTGNF